MNIKQAKTIDLNNFLNICGYFPVDTKKNGNWYISPFRNEDKPSFKIENNLWFDFGIGKGGTIIDFLLMEKRYNLNTIQEVLNYLSNIEVLKTNNIKKEKIKNNKEYILTDLKKKSLIEYLTSRNLDITRSKKYVKQIKYKVNEKEYFGIAFKSSKGFEVRNKYFKGCFGEKSTSFIKGENSKEISIFEGFIDFLSILTLYKIDKFKSDVLILNSLSLLYKQDFKSYEKIYLFLDNDNSGVNAKEQLKKQYKDKIRDKSKLYAEYKDINEMLVKNKENKYFFSPAKTSFKMRRFYEIRKNNNK